MTTITDSISGLTYATPQLWFNTIPSTLDRNYEGRQDNSEILVTSTQSLSGITDAGFSVKLTAGAGNSFADNANKGTNALRYNAGNGAAIRRTAGNGPLFDIQCPNFTLSRLMISDDAPDGGRALSMTNGANAGRVVDQCILVAGSNSYGNTTIFDGSTLTCKNTLLIHRHASGGHGYFNHGGDSDFQNVTIVNLGTATSKTGFDKYSGSPTLKNVAVYGFATDFAGTAGTCSNNASDKASFGGTNYNGGTPQFSIVGATEWESVASGTEDFRLKGTSAKLKDNGTATGVPATDIVGQSRSGSTDIGVWELQAGGGAAAFANPLALLGVGRAA